jgi:hypothetical protein
MAPLFVAAFRPSTNSCVTGAPELSSSRPGDLGDTLLQVAGHPGVEYGGAAVRLQMAVEMVAYGAALTPLDHARGEYPGALVCLHDVAMQQCAVSLSSRLVQDHIACAQIPRTCFPCCCCCRPRSHRQGAVPAAAVRPAGHGSTGPGLDCGTGGVQVRHISRWPLGVHLDPSGCGSCVAALLRDANCTSCWLQVCLALHVQLWRNFYS